MSKLHKISSNKEFSMEGNRITIPISELEIEKVRRAISQKWVTILDRNHQEGESEVGKIFTRKLLSWCSLALGWEAKQAVMQGQLIAYEACNKRRNQREIIELESKYKFSESKLVNDNKVKHRKINPVKYYYKDSRHWKCF